MPVTVPPFSHSERLGTDTKPKRRTESSSTWSGALGGVACVYAVPPDALAERSMPWNATVPNGGFQSLESMLTSASTCSVQ